MTGTVSNSDIINVNNIVYGTAKNGGTLQDQLNGLQSAGYITSQENQIEAQYLSTFTNTSDPINYSISAESIVNSATDLSSSSKTKILISMSVARNSYLLWTN